MKTFLLKLKSSKAFWTAIVALIGAIVAATATEIDDAIWNAVQPEIVVEEAKVIEQ